MSPLVISEILGLFADTLTVNYKYFFYNSENLLHQIQMPLSKKQKHFPKTFALILEST